jgi:hypothetical protein
MGITDKELMELREIILWQQLNKQMIELKEHGKPLSDENQKALQAFCFDNTLFETVTRDPLLDDVPMSLVMDFSGISFLTLKATAWNECLLRLIPDAAILNIEQALADAFDVITNYDRKHGWFEAEADEDDDGLYDFIGRYDSVLTEEQRDWNGLLQEVYAFKVSALTQALGGEEVSRGLKIDKHEILLDLSSNDAADRISATYLDLFVKRAASRMEKIFNATGAMRDMDALGFLKEKEEESNLKPSIKEFIDHARDSYSRKQTLMKDFSRSLAAAANQRGLSYIRICDPSPFAFLKSPFPVV